MYHSLEGIYEIDSISIMNEIYVIKKNTPSASQVSGYFRIKFKFVFKKKVTLVKCSAEDSISASSCFFILASWKKNKRVDLRLAEMYDKQE